MDVVRLTAIDYDLLRERAADHGNSQRKMVSALIRAGNEEALERIRTLRRIERHFMIDLGSLCQRFARRHEQDTHPIERFVLGYVALRKSDDNGDEELWVLVDRVRQVRDVMGEGDVNGDWQP